MKTNLSSIKEIMNKHRTFLRNNYSVKNIGVFGSVSRGEEGIKSDVDMLVEFSESPGMFKFIELEEYLTKLLSRKVDLVTRKALKPAISKEIVHEVVYV